MRWILRTFILCGLAQFVFLVQECTVTERRTFAAVDDTKATQAGAVVEDLGDFFINVTDEGEGLQECAEQCCQNPECDVFSVGFLPDNGTYGCELMKCHPTTRCRFASVDGVTSEIVKRQNITVVNEDDSSAQSNPAPPPQTNETEPSEPQGETKVQQSETENNTLSREPTQDGGADNGTSPPSPDTQATGNNSTPVSPLVSNADVELFTSPPSNEGQGNLTTPPPVKDAGKDLFSVAPPVEDTSSGNNATENAQEKAPTVTTQPRTQEQTQQNNIPETKANANNSTADEAVVIVMNATVMPAELNNTTHFLPLVTTPPPLHETTLNSGNSETDEVQQNNTDGGSNPSAPKDEYTTGPTIFITTPSQEIPSINISRVSTSSPSKQSTPSLSTEGVETTEAAVQSTLAMEVQPISTNSSSTTPLADNMEISSDNGTTSHNDTVYADTRDQKSNFDTVAIPTIIAIFSFSLVLIIVVSILVGKRCFESWRRRHYQKVDYLVEGMYS